MMFGKEANLEVLPKTGTIVRRRKINISRPCRVDKNVLTL